MKNQIEKWTETEIKEAYQSESSAWESIRDQYPDWSMMDEDQVAKLNEDLDGNPFDGDRNNPDFQPQIIIAGWKRYDEQRGWSDQPIILYTDACVYHLRGSGGYEDTYDSLEEPMNFCNPVDEKMDIRSKISENKILFDQWYDIGIGEVLLIERPAGNVGVIYRDINGRGVTDDPDRVADIVDRIIKEKSDPPKYNFTETEKKIINFLLANGATSIKGLSVALKLDRSSISRSTSKLLLKNVVIETWQTTANGQRAEKIITLKTILSMP